MKNFEGRRIPRATGLAVLVVPLALAGCSGNKTSEANLSKTIKPELLALGYQAVKYSADTADAENTACVGSIFEKSDTKFTCDLKMSNLDGDTTIKYQVYMDNIKGLPEPKTTFFMSYDYDNQLGSYDTTKYYQLTSPVGDNLYIDGGPSVSGWQAQEQVTDSGMGLSNNGAYTYDTSNPNYWLLYNGSTANQELAETAIAVVQDIKNSNKDAALSATS